MTEMKKMFRGNKLEELWNSIWEYRISKHKKQYEGIGPGFLGQRHSEKRQEKNKTMKAIGLKTGKKFRHYMKDLRRQNRIASAAKA